jgi:anti-anti-sigma regulatory factor/DNA-directed RNA polymerase subunit RPC12/RpoP
MNMRTKGQGVGVSYHCPVCGNTLPFEAPVVRFDAPCSGCGSHIWCRQRSVAGSEELVLEVLPERTPQPWDVDHVVSALVRNGTFERVVLDMSRLEIVNSSFVARLVAMNKKIRAVGGRLYLQGLSPVMREIFGQLRLDKAVLIIGDDGTVERVE